ncbi:MAG: pitrilysin family protein [Gammaproteobacteria bacterium]
MRVESTSITAHSCHQATAHHFPSRSKPRPWRQWIIVLAVVVLGGTPLLGSAKNAPDVEKNVTRATLDNGLRVVIIRNPLAPVVSTVMNYLVGSDEAPKGYPGMAHALEHMMFRGTPDLSADQLSAIGAGMGGSFNAQTRQHLTQYFYTVPAQDLNVALHIEAARMRNILSNEKLWDKERGAIEQEVAADMSNPQYVFYTRLIKHLFAGTPYAHDALGTRPSFDKTTIKMLHKFYSTWYTPNNAILVISGAVQPDKVLAQVKTLFGSIPRKKLPARPAVHLQPVKAITLHQTTDRPFSVVTIAMRMPGYDSPDYAAAQVLGDVLNNQRADLYGLVVKGDALGAGFDQNALPKAGLGFATLLFPAGNDPKPPLHKLKAILTHYAKNGVPPDLVAAAKRRQLTAVEFRKNSVRGLAMMWAEALASQRLHSPQDSIDAIQRVTVADVNRVARTYFNFSHAVTGILTPSPSGKPVSSQEFKGEESFSSSHVKDVKLPKWAAAELSRLPMPKSLINPVVSTLPNGLTLIVQPETISDTVSLTGRIKHNADIQTPKGKEGVSNVLAHLFSFGTTHLDRLSFQKAVDDIGAELDAGTSFYAQALTDNFDRAVALVADNELHPALPKKAFSIVRTQVAASLKGLLQSPDYLTQRALHTALYPADDPALREATPKTVTALSLKDVHDYYHSVFRPDMTTIVVIGDITPKKARAIVEKYFGSWKAEGPKPNTLLPKVPLNKPSVTHVPDASHVQDQVTLAQTMGLTRFDPDYYALQLGNHVLSGGFYASRLYHDLREEAGLVYFVGSSVNAGETRGLFSVSYASDPPKVAQARAMILRDLTAMQTTPVSKDELHQAKSLILRQIALSDASLNSISNRLLAHALIGLPLDETTRAAHRYYDMSAKQVQDAFKKWVNPENLAQVVEGPPR